MALILQIKGLEELRAAFRALPKDLQREAAVIVQAQAEAARQQIAAAYPERTGNLRRGLRVETRADPTSDYAILRNYAPHAVIFEKGTKPRRWKSGKSTGRMPPGNVFLPIANRRRQMMVNLIVDIVERHGLHVSGLAA